MTYKGARHGYVFDREVEPTDDISDINRKFCIKIKKKAIASTKLNVKANTEYFAEKENLTNYTPHTDDGFKQYKREIAQQQLDTVGKIKLPWER